MMAASALRASGPSLGSVRLKLSSSRRSNVHDETAAIKNFYRFRELLASGFAVKLIDF